MQQVRVEQSTYVCFFCNTLVLYHNLNYVKLKGKIHLSSCVITDTNVFAISMVTFRACAAEAPLQIVTRRVFCAWPLACFAFISV